MFEIVGSWLDWKRSQVSAALSNVAFDAHYRKLEKSIKKETKKTENVEEKDDTKVSSEDNKSTSSKTHDEEPAAVKAELTHETNTNNNLKKDMTELYKLKSDVTNRQKKLLKLQKSIKLEESTKKELYEITLRKEVVEKIEKKLNEKILEAKSLLKKDEISDSDLEKIKRIIIYCKKKSSIMISELNNEVYNEENVRVILKELLASMNNISGLVIVKNKMNITGSMMSLLYDLVYELIDNISNQTMMIYVSKENNTLIVKILISSLISIKEKLKLDSNIKVKESLCDTDTELLFTIKAGDIL